MSVMTAPFLKLSSSLCDPLKLYMAFTRVTPATPDILKREEAGTALFTLTYSSQLTTQF